MQHPGGATAKKHRRFGLPDHPQEKVLDQLIPCVEQRSNSRLAQLDNLVTEISDQGRHVEPSSGHPETAYGELKRDGRLSGSRVVPTPLGASLGLIEELLDP